MLWDSKKWSKEGKCAPKGIESPYTIEAIEDKELLALCATYAAKNENLKALRHCN